MSKRIGILVLGGLLLGLGGCQIPRPNQPPFPCFNVNPTSGVAPLEVIFDASCSRDNDGHIVLYTFYPGDGGIIQANVPIARYIYQRPGTFTPLLIVEDNRGARAQITGPTVTVIENKPPVACFTITQIAWNIFIFDPFCSYDPDGYIVESIWRIDGREFRYSGLRRIRVEFLRSGVYLVTLIVKDNMGATSSWSLQVTVLPPAPPPPQPPTPPQQLEEREIHEELKVGEAD